MKAVRYGFWGLTAGVCVAGFATSTVAQSPSLGSELLAIGALNLPAEEVLGDVQDLGVDSHGNLYILDGQAAAIRVFDPSGSYLTTLGSPGQGPGEFRGALSLLVDGDDLVHVSDGENARISRFSLDEEPHFVGDVRPEVVPLDLCGMGARFWVFQRARGEGLVFELDWDGAAIAALAPKESPPPDLDLIFGGSDHLWHSQLRITCAPHTGTVVLAHHAHPIIRAFGTDTEERWRVELDDFNVQQYRRDAQGNCCYARIPDPRTGSYTLLHEIVADDIGHLWITLGEHEPAVGVTDFEVRVLHAGSGREVARIPSTGVILAVQNGLAYQYEEAPYPRVRVLEVIR